MSSIPPNLKPLPPIDPDEEPRLILAAQQGDAAAWDRLVRSNLLFVIKQAGKARALEFDDAVQIGLLGLLRAIEKWEADKGANLRTYAKWWVDAYLKDAVLRVPMVRPWTTQRARSLRAAVLRRAGDLALTAFQLLAIPEEVAALAESQGVTEDFVLSLAAAFQDPFQIDHPLPGTEDLRPTLPDRDPLPDALVVDAQLDAYRRSRLYSAMQELPDRERAIVSRRHLAEDPQTLQEVGDELGISRERVRQLEHRALRRIRERLRLGACSRPADLEAGPTPASTME